MGRKVVRHDTDLVSQRFFNHMLSYKYDIGLHIVPKHIFEGQDWQKFAAFDLEKGYPVTTGPWKVVNVSPTQKVVDRRDSWWGVAAGVGKLPEVERIFDVLDEEAAIGTYYWDKRRYGVARPREEWLSIPVKAL